MTQVSVIIPAFNAGRFLRQAVESVWAQEHPDIEIVVVNDGSTDDTAAVMETLTTEGPLVCVTHSTNRGLPATRNTGVGASTGTYLAFLDADDRFLPGKLTRQAAFLDAHPELGLVAGGLELVDEEGSHLAWQRPWLHTTRIDLERLALVGLVGVHGVLLRRQWFEQVGGFNESLAYCEDMDLWWRLFAAGCSMGWLPAIEGVYRVHMASMSQRLLEHHQWRVALLRDQLESGMLSPDIVARANVAIAQQNVAVAGRLYGAGKSNEGKAMLEEALDTAPTLLSECRPELLDAIAAWRDDAWIRSRATVHCRAMAHLPGRLSWLAAHPRILEVAYWRRRFYHAVVESDRQGLWRAWLQVALRDRRWLCNRGSWSLFLRSLGCGTWQKASTPAPVAVEGGRPSLGKRGG